MSSIVAQPLTQSVIGQVVSKNGGKPLTGATIQIEGTELGAFADEQGYYKIENIPVGRHTMVVTQMGYQTVTIPNIWFTSAKQEVMQIEMEEAYFSTKDIVISAEKTQDKTKTVNELATISARTFTIEETSRYAGSLSDPSRMAANFAGVVGTNDQLNAIVVRGNSPTGVLWRLEGIDIDNPSHFALFVNFGGFFNILNNSLLANSDFMTGAFPAEYGNKTAAVFDIRMRNGNFEKREFAAQVGINGLEANVEGPISKNQRSSYIASYRFFNFGVINQLGLDFKIGGLPTYQDVNFKLNFPTRKMGRFSVFGIGGISKIAILDSEKDSADWNFQTGGSDVYYTSNRGVLGVSNQHTFSEKLYGKAIVSLMGSYVNSDLEIVTLNAPTVFKEKINSQEVAWQTKYELNYRPHIRHLLKVGLSYRGSDFAYKYVDSINHERSEVLNQTAFFQSFLHWQWKVSRKLTFNTGLYGQMYSLGSARSLEPRFAAQYAFSPKQSLTFGYGMHSQTQIPLVYNSDWNRNLGFSKSHHWIVGYNYYPLPLWRTKVEVYYQSLFHLPISQQLGYYSVANLGEGFDFGIPDSLVGQGKGYNYGAELTLEKFYDKGYYFLSTLSLYQSKFQGSDGKWRNTAFNTQFAYNILGGYTWTLGKEKQNAISADVKFTIVGGQPFIPIDIAASQAQQQEVRDYAAAYTVRKKNFQRLDVKVSYRLNRPKITHFLFIGCNNLLDYKNELSNYYDPVSQTVRYNYMLGIFPYGGYKIQF